MGARVYVGGLDERVTDRDLHDDFDRYGRIHFVWVARKPPDYEDLRDAEDAVRGMTGRNGWRVEISKKSFGARGNPPGEGRGGGRGGGGGGFGGGGGGGGRDMACYNCGEVGHLARDCRAIKGAGGGGGGRGRDFSPPRGRGSPPRGRYNSRSPVRRDSRSPLPRRDSPPRGRDSPPRGRDSPPPARRERSRSPY